MSSKTTALILGGLVAAGVAAYFVTRPKAPAVKPQTARAPTPKVTDPTAWTPPVGYPTLPAGWALPEGAVPQAGWVPPLNWSPPSWLPAVGWAPGQPIPGFPLPPPIVPKGTPTVGAIAPGPRGEAVAAQRAYKLGYDDGGPVGWNIPGIPSTMEGLPPIPGLTGSPTASGPREMSPEEKVALWRTLFANKIKWINYCYDPAAGCMNAKGTIGDMFVAGTKGVLMAQDIAYLNDASIPRDDSYDNPGWFVLYSPSTGVYWMLGQDDALKAVLTDDWTIFLRTNEYHLVQLQAGREFIVPDDLAFGEPSVTGEPTSKQGLASWPSIPGLGSNFPIPSIPGLPNPYPNGFPGIPNPGGGGGFTMPTLGELPSGLKLPGM